MSFNQQRFSTTSVGLMKWKDTGPKLKQKAKEENEKLKFNLLVEGFVKPLTPFYRLPYPSSAKLRQLFLEFEMIVVKEIQRMLPFHFNCIFLDDFGWNFGLESGHKEAESYLKEYITKCAPYIKCRIVPYVKSMYNYEVLARSLQRRAAVGNSVCLVTGILAGYPELGNGIVVTAGHLVAAVGDVVEIGGGIYAKCIAKSDIIKGKDNQLYTADLAFLKITTVLGNDNGCDKIEIEGKIYRRQLWRGGVDELKPGTEVWMYNQCEEIKKGIIDRKVICDKEANLYNVLVVKPKDEKIFSTNGDSGACVFIPPEPGSDMVYVFGMVISKNTNTELTNVVILECVLPCMIRPFVPDEDDASIFKNLEFVGSVCVSENLDVHETSRGRDEPECFDPGDQNNNVVSEDSGDVVQLDPSECGDEGESGSTTVVEGPDSGIGLASGCRI